MTADEAEERAAGWAEEIGEGVKVLETESTIGGGSLPGETLPTWALAIGCEAFGGAEAVAKRLRDASTPVMGRIEDGQVMLDARTVLPEEDSSLIAAVKHALRGRDSAL